MKCLNCRFSTYDEFNPINMLGCSVLTLRQTKVFLAHCFLALGHDCKFVPWCKTLYRIGPWSGFWPSLILKLTFLISLSTTLMQLIYSFFILVYFSSIQSPYFFCEVLFWFDFFRFASSSINALSNFLFILSPVNRNPKNYLKR